MKQLTTKESETEIFHFKIGKVEISFKYQTYNTSTPVIKGENDLCKTLVLDNILN